MIIESNIINHFEINDISSLENIKNNSIIFLDKKQKTFNYQSKKLILIISDDKSQFLANKFNNFILVKDVDSAYRNLISKMYFHDDLKNLDHHYEKINNSFISKYATIHKTAEIQNNCVIGRGVVIEENCIVKNNSVLKNCIIKNNVIISDNTTIGSTGFGFNLKNMGASLILPHIGIVIINENVSIGSNCTIDRGKIDCTVIGKNTMIDNLIHIAHNVVIGENVCIAAQTGISGSTTIGNNVIIGGQVGIAGHINIGDNVVIAAKSGVTKSIVDSSVIAGFPAIDLKKWKKMIIKNKNV